MVFSWDSETEGWLKNEGQVNRVIENPRVHISLVWVKQDIHDLHSSIRIA